MSNIPVTLTAGSLRPAGSTGGEAAVRVIDPSPDLTRLATGENLRGTVVGKDDHGHLLVRTRLGVLTLAASRPLPAGTEVVLQVRSVGPHVILNLLPLDRAGGGAPVQPGQGPQAPTAPATPAAVQAPGGDFVQRGHLIRAVLHAAPPMPALAGLPTAQPGTELMARVLSLGVQSPGSAAVGPQAPGAAGPAAAPGGAGPGPGPAPAGGSAPGLALPASGAGAVAAGAGSAAPAGSKPAGAAATGLPAPRTTASVPPAPGSITSAALPTPADPAAPGLRLAPQAAVASSGHNLAAALQGLTTEAAAKAAGTLPTTSPPGAPPSTAAPAAAGSLRVTGLVTAATNSGQPIVHTPLGTLTLDTRAPLAPGTSLALEIALPPQGRAAAPLTALAAAWPSLENLEESLLHGLPAAQSEAVTRALPQVGPRLASGVLFLLSALNQGNVAGWLAKAGLRGEPGDRGDILERLGREFAGLARSVDSAAGEWRLVNLPLWSDQGLRELRCFFRHQEHGGRGGGDGDKATRFVLELELTRHGELQLDGLVRGQLFDLVLRSRQPLPSLVRGDLLALFEETNAIAGYSGRLSFQASQDWMQLLAARTQQAPHEGLRV